MESRRVGEALLRSQRSSLTFLTPSMPSRCPSIAQKALHSPHRRGLKRSFASSVRSAAISTPAATSEPRRADGETSERTSKPLDWLRGTGSNRTSSFSSTQANTANPASSSIATESERLMNKGSSAADLLAALNSARKARTSNDFNIDRMADPKMPNMPNMDPTGSLMKDLRNRLSKPPPQRPPMRLTPVTGRTVNVTPNIDTGRCFKLMEQLVARNKIKATFNYQRFHERPGLKRKRLKSLRWRKRFIGGFKAAVTRVRQLTRQGW